MDHYDDQHQPQQQAEPTLIEEEPAHELYARICGVPSSRSLDRHPHHQVASNAHRPLIIRRPESFMTVNTRIPEDQKEKENRINSKSVHEFQKAMLYASAGQHDDGVKKKKMKLQAGRSRSTVALNTSQHLAIDRSNRGYRLLSRMGFREEEGGLGKRRQGRLKPILPKVKLDLRGVGSNSKSSATSKKKSKSTQQRSGQQQQYLESVRRDKTARLLLRTDISVEHEELHFALSR
mmetsp:Transcript_28803/g.44777  ORF Transcript_28803/g.44777 Transcript_28803/m.44777 type:complete len:235 (-) Transcript_28803:1142-1846(-)